MKKALLTIGIILVALAIMAPAPDKAEKLKVDNHDYARDAGQFVISMSCMFGIATAGEHANFTTRTVLTFEADGVPHTLQGTGGINKVDGATKDADGYIAIEPLTIGWDRNGGTFSGVVSVVATTQLVGPSGKDQGEAVVTYPDVTIELPPVMIDEEGWDFNSDANAIVVPLFAHIYFVKVPPEETYSVRVDVDVFKKDEAKTLAGSGLGIGIIEKFGPGFGDFVQIPSVLAILDEGLEWNGDDDGSQIVTGQIKLFDAAGNEVETMVFPEQVVGFIIPEPPEY
jgi:hypothetical protein